ncbi:MAG: DUF2493 domain-containing protein [Bacteroidota bacterium]
MKIIIAGSRTFQDYERLVAICDQLLGSMDLADDPIEIVSGAARGADQLGEAYASSKGYIIQRFPADWAKWGKMAGPLRNQAMAAYADGAIIFWDGRSRGTKHLIRVLRKEGKWLKIVGY